MRVRYFPSCPVAQLFCDIITVGFWMNILSAKMSKKVLWRRSLAVKGSGGFCNLPASLPVGLCACLPIHPSILSICPSVCLLYLSIHPSIHNACSLLSGCTCLLGALLRGRWGCVFLVGVGNRHCWSESRQRGALACWGPSSWGKGLRVLHELKEQTHSSVLCCPRMWQWHHASRLWFVLSHLGVLWWRGCQWTGLGPHPLPGTPGSVQGSAADLSVYSWI